MYIYFDMELVPVEQFLHQLGGEVDVVFLACHTPGQQLATGEVISQAIVRSLLLGYSVAGSQNSHDRRHRYSCCRHSRHRLAVVYVARATSLICAALR